MDAIQTKYIAPTNNRAARIKAWSGRYTVTVPYNHKLNYQHVHFEAVKELIKKHELDWNISKMTYGETEQGYVFCFPHLTVES